MDNLSYLSNEDHLLDLERLAALGYSIEQMAMYFKVPLEQFKQAAENSLSTTSFHIRRGQLMSIAKEEMAILEQAEGGNITASQHLARIRRNRGFEISKLDIFGGFEDQSAFQKLEDFIQSAGTVELSKEEAIYLEALTLMNSMDRKYGRRNVIAFFTKRPFNLSYSRASEMYDEAINLFYSDRNTEKKALRNKRAEMLEEAARMVLKMASCSKDLEIYGNLIVQASKLQGLDKDDAPVLPQDVYMKPVRLFSLDPAIIGLPAVNRQEVAAQIDMLEIPERDKLRLRQDAMLDQINLESNLDELEEESRSR